MKAKLQRVLALLVFAALLVFGWRHSGSIDWREVLRAPYWAFASLLLCYGTIHLNFQIWFRLLNRNQPVLSWPAAYRLYALASLSRYLPGGQFWQYASLLKFTKTSEGKLQTTTAQFFATLCGLSGGFLLLLLNLSALKMANNHLAFILSFFFLALLVTVFSHAPSRARLSRILYVLSCKRFAAIPPIKVRHFLNGILQSALSWMITCLAYLALLTMVGQSPSFSLFGFLMAAYAVATLGAYVSFLTPAGLGVREGIFAALLAVRMPPGEAVFVSLAGGFTLFLAECVFLLPFLISHLLSVKRVSSADR